MSADPDEPILSRAYRRIGIATAVIGTLLGIAPFIQGRILTALLTFLAGLGGAVLCFGIAEVVRFIAAIAKNTRDTVLVLQRHLAAVADQRRERSAEAAATPALPALPSRQRLAGQIYHYSADGTQSGPFTAQDMKDFCSADVVSEETLVFKEGESEWRPLRSFPELRT